MQSVKNALANKLYSVIVEKFGKEPPAADQLMEMLEYPIKARLVRIASEKAMGKNFVLEKKHTDEILKLLSAELR